MDKPHKIPQIYGYTVCLVAVITVLICVKSLVKDIIDLGDPLHAEGAYLQYNLASFETYKMDARRFAARQGDVENDESLRATYEAIKADKIQSVQHVARRTIIVSSLLIVLCIALFTTHWRWMRKFGRIET